MLLSNDGKSEYYSLLREQLRDCSAQFHECWVVYTETAEQPGILQLSISVTSILDYRNAIGTEHSDIPLQKALVLKSSLTYLAL